MRPRLRLAPLPPDRRDRLRARCENAPAPDTRTRYPMVGLATPERRSPAESARVVLRRHATVQRVRQRFLTGGRAAVPRRPAPGPTCCRTQAGDAALGRLVAEEPRQDGVEAANWPIGLLAPDRSPQFGSAVNPATVRRTVQRLGDVGKRPTGTVQHQAQEREGPQGPPGGNACGESFSSPRPPQSRRGRLLDPPPHPVLLARPPLRLARPGRTGLGGSRPGGWSRLAAPPADGRPRRPRRRRPPPPSDAAPRREAPRAARPAHGAGTGPEAHGWWRRRRRLARRLALPRPRPPTDGGDLRPAAAAPQRPLAGTPADRQRPRRHPGHAHAPRLDETAGAARGARGPAGSGLPTGVRSRSEPSRTTLATVSPPGAPEPAPSYPGRFGPRRPCPLRGTRPQPVVGSPPNRSSQHYRPSTLPPVYSGNANCMWSDLAPY
jgi:hypothetical protein